MSRTIPVPSASRYEHRFPAVAANVAPVREAVVAVARRAGMDEPALADLAVAVSEALTNGVLHAFPDRPGSVTVAAGTDDGCFAVTITDDGCGMRARDDSPGLGLGLSLMGRLCGRVQLSPGPQGVGTSVHMTFPLGDAPAPRRRHTHAAA
jgi:anti-sigma regulatory factor (Ser/Thr protein kinase)